MVLLGPATEGRERGEDMARFLGGTGILLVVSVALDIVQKVESHLIMRNYEGFGKRGRGKKGGR